MLMFFFFVQKSANEIRISDWSSDVCSSDLGQLGIRAYDLFTAQAADARRLQADVLDAARHGSEHNEVADFKGFVQADGDRCKQVAENGQIGRASCRERVCQYV